MLACTIPLVNNVAVDNRTTVVTSSVSRICQLNLPEMEMLVEIGLRACIYRGEFACGCTVFRKKFKCRILETATRTKGPFSLG
jgi:hypothetical protein